MKEDDVDINKLAICVRKKALTDTELSGHVVRIDYQLPWETDLLSKADAKLVMPVSFNVINKWT